MSLSTSGILRRFLAVAVLAGALLGGATPAVSADGPATRGVVAQAQAPAATKGVVKVKTTANLNLRTGAGTGYRIVLTIPLGTTLSVTDTAANGWYKVGYAGRTGWVSNGYVTVVASGTVSNVKLWVTATANLNVRRGAGTGHAVVGLLPKGAAARATSRAANGWYEITGNGTTGWVSNRYVTTCSRGCQVDTGAYTTNRAGLRDRYFTRNNGSDLYAAVGGALRIGDITKNSIVYRDLAWEKDAGQVSGWYFVRTQGATGWMKASALKRASSAGSGNTRGYTRAQVLRQQNGRINTGMLLAIPWDTEKTLIAAPALGDLTRLNTAFAKKFGRNLDIDLAYRTLDTQKYFYRELGPYIAATPGTSNHGWGLAIDVPETRDYSFRGKYYAWLKANSHRYNWVHRKNLEEFRADGTRNPYAEAWHFEYVGR